MKRKKYIYILNTIYKRRLMLKMLFITKIVLLDVYKLII